jgi:hypothetical protein
LTRYLYGGIADYAFDTGTDTGSGVPLLLQPGAELRFYSALTGGVEYGLGATPADTFIDLDENVIAAGAVTATAFGAMPPLYSPEDITIMYMSANGGPRRAIFPVEAASMARQAQLQAAQAQATADAALAAAGTGGGGAVASVQGKTGNVVLNPGDIGALPAAGGGVITIAEGDTTTQALIIRLPTGNRDSAVDTFATYINTGTAGAPVWRRVFFLNEVGMPRVISFSPTEVPLRVKQYNGTQTADLFEVTDLDNNPLGGFRNDGRVFAPNIGNARLSQGLSAPTAPAVRDVWIDGTMSPPGVKVWTGSQWVLAQASTGAEPPPPPASAPDFVAATNGYINATGLTLAQPAGDTLIALVAWNAASAITPPPGWTLVDELVGGSGRAGVWAADSSVASFTWSHGATAFKTSGLILGYEACNVTNVTELLEDTVEGVHTAPAIAPSMAPATILRLWWDKASTTTSITLPGSHTQRAVQYGTGSSAPAVIGADLAVTTTDLVAAANATFNASSAQAGGFSLALVAA